VAGAFYADMADAAFASETHLLPYRRIDTLEKRRGEGDAPVGKRRDVARIS